MKKYNFYPFTHKGCVRENDNKAVLWCEFKGSSNMNHYNGYVAIPKKDIPKSWWGNYNTDYLQYLKIHGGITYCQVEGKYVVFGFDCAHWNDLNNPFLLEPDNIMKMVEQMENLIKAYAKRYQAWTNASGKRKVKIIDEINKKWEVIPEDFGFAANLNILAGRV